MWQRACLAAGLVLLTVGAQAADEKGRFKIEGAGALRCDAYTKIRQEHGDNYKLVLSWMDGYLTAANELSPDTFDVLPWQQPELVGILIDGFCQQNKEANLVAAVGQLVKALMPQRTKSMPEITTAEAGGRKVPLYKDVMRQVQERLIKAGHLKGKADGSYGPGTRAALESFQKANNIEATGLPDQRTLAFIFYSAGEQPQGAAQPRQQGNAQPRQQAPAAASGAGSQSQPKLDLRLNPQ